MLRTNCYMQVKCLLPSRQIMLYTLSDLVFFLNILSYASLCPYKLPQAASLLSPLQFTFSHAGPGAVEAETPSPALHALPHGPLVACSLPCPRHKYPQLLDHQPSFLQPPSITLFGQQRPFHLQQPSLPTTYLPDTSLRSLEALHAGEL